MELHGNLLKITLTTANRLTKNKTLSLTNLLICYFINYATNIKFMWQRIYIKTSILHTCTRLTGSELPI
jgi:hypothetical protein